MTKKALKSDSGAGVSGQRYFLAQDQDSHWYVIPVDHMADWNFFTSIDPDDERSWKVPDYAQEVGGSPSLITFTDPQESE